MMKSGCFRFANGSSKGAMVLAAFLAGCASSVEEPLTSDVRALQAASCAETPPLAKERSLFIHRRDVLSAAMPFERVWLKLNENVPNPRFPLQHPDPLQRAPVRLFQQWADTLNPRSEAAYVDPAYPHCDDEHPVYALPGSPHANVSRLNGFEQHCPRPFGKYAREIPFSHTAVVNGQTMDVKPWFNITPVALVNRIDLTPSDYETCGEVRLEFYLDGPDRMSPLHSPSAESLEDEFFFILEAKIPNPQPGCRSRCRDFAQEWAELSLYNADIPLQQAQMVSRLEAILFQGVRGFAPVVRWQNFSGNLGQIRTNDFVQVSQVAPGMGQPLSAAERSTPWTLRQYQLELLCRPFQREQTEPTRKDYVPNLCELVMKPRPVDDSPSGTLVSSSPLMDARAAQYAQALVSQLPRLTQSNNLNELSLSFDTALLPFESRMERTPRFSLEPEFYETPDQSLLDTVSAALANGQNPHQIDAMQVVQRAGFLTCAGCHHLSYGAPDFDALGGGVTYDTFPNRFFHVSSQLVPCSPPGTSLCYQLSGGLENTFLPHRQETFESFLNPDEGGCGPCTGEVMAPPSDTSKSQRRTIGGRPVGGSHH